MQTTNVKDTQPVEFGHQLDEDEATSWAYLTLVCPELEYCASIWYPHKQEDIQTLKVVNRGEVRS